MTISISAIVICALLVIVGIAVAKWWFQKDTEAENRRRVAAHLAAVLKSLGLRRIPAFLIDYSVGDYSGMVHRIAETARFFMEGEESVVKEFDAVYERILELKLKTPEGRALLAAKLSDAVRSADPSSVQTHSTPPVPQIQPNPAMPQAAGTYYVPMPAPQAANMPPLSPAQGVPPVSPLPQVAG